MLVKARLFAWKAAGKTVMACAFPFFLIDKAFEWFADVVTILCAIAASPCVIFYDWCVKRHNDLHALARQKEGGEDG